MKKILEKIKAFFASKIIWVQILTIVSVLFSQYADMGFMNASLGLFISFSATVILQKFWSSSAIVKTGTEKDTTMFWMNLVAALLMITDYFLANQIFTVFGLSASKVGMAVATLNIVLRTYFVNQPAK